MHNQVLIFSLIASCFVTRHMRLQGVLHRITPPFIASIAVCAFGLLMALPALAAPTQMVGKVVYVDDGDTVVLLVDGRNQVKIRLSSIDAPETSHTNKEVGRIGQPLSEGATRFLAASVKGRTVEARCFEMDRYGREVCELFSNGQSVNQDLVRNGWAWANTAASGRYLRDRSLIGLQQAARASGLGLWKSHNPVPPWEWRDLCWKQHHCSQ